MTQEQINEGNKLIAEFIGCKKDKSWNNWYKVPKKYQKAFGTQGFGIGTNCKFHSSWDWLMPVVRKIVVLCVDDADELFLSDQYTSILDTIPVAVIEDSWKVVVEFIKWYNDESRKNN